MAGIPVKTWDAFEALRAGVLPIESFFDPTDSNPFSLIEQAGHTDRAMGLNWSALLNSSNGLLAQAVVDILNAGITVNKLVTLALAGAADTGAGIGVWQNPEVVEIHIDLVIVTSSVVAAAADNLDVGVTEVSATTVADNLIDGLDIHSALILGASNLTNPGANGKAAKILAPAKWVTFSTADGGAASGFVGKAYIRYTPLN